MDDAIDRACRHAIDRAKRGDLKFFKEAPLDILLKARDSYGDNTVLSMVVKNNHLECCEVICKRCPSLLYHQAYPDRIIPLHIAAYNGYLDILKLLISACNKADEEGDRVVKQKTLMLTTRYGDNAMHNAVYGSQPDSVKLLIEADPNKELLRAGDRKNNTPLHLVVGQLKSDPVIARLLIKADPDFPYGVNSDRKTPLLIAIHQSLSWPYDRVMLKLIMELQPTQSMVSVNENGWTALHYCVNENGGTALISGRILDTIEYIIQSCPESSKVADKKGQNFFHLAVNLGNVERVEELYKAYPSLIYHQSKGGRTALHHAAWRGEPKMLKFLIAAGAKSYNKYAKDDIESGGGEKIPQKMLLTMLDDQGDTALHRAVLNHKLEAVKLLIEADPVYEYGANTSGKTPIMISVLEARLNKKKSDSEKIKKLLFKMPSQTMTRTGKNNWTLLHQATFNGDLSIMEDLIKFCPNCLELVDNEGKNFLHIAAKWGKVEVVRLVLRKKDIPFNVLNDQDNDGNTPLHIAAITGNEPLTRCFLFHPRVIKTTVNKADEHVLSAIKFSYDKWRAGVVDIAGTVNESDLKEQRDFDLVVGALIATVSFTAGITVPGGYNSDGPNQGTAIFSKEVSFAAFIISNTFALIFSLYAVFSHFCARRMRKEVDIIYQLNVATLCTVAAIYCMMAAFIAGSFAVLANSKWLAIVVCIISCLFFIFACRPMWKIAMQRKRVAPASQHKRST